MQKCSITLSIVVAAACCLLLCPRHAAADPVDVVTLHFMGNLVCDPTSPPCSPSTGTITGTFSVDPDTASIVGPWSFSTPFGTISSSGNTAGTGFFSFAGLVGFEFVNTSGNVSDFIETFFLASAIPGDGPIVPGNPTEGGLALINGAGQCNVLGTPCSVFYDFTSGASTPTPEPSSLLLLGTGLLGLGPFIRRRM